MTRSSTIFRALPLCLLLAAQASAATAPSLSAEEDEAQAVARVNQIVNQPVTHLARASQAAVFPGWFHPGAVKPDFATVDIRTTQEFPYRNIRFVTSPLNPNEMFDADELEFNAMTKFFYQDRSLPKHRLSEQDMVEINALYRRIAHDEQAISTHRFELGAGGIALMMAAGGALAFSYWRRRERA